MVYYKQLWACLLYTSAQQFQLGIAAYQPVGDGAGQPIAQDLTHQRRICLLYTSQHC